MQAHFEAITFCLSSISIIKPLILDAISDRNTLTSARMSRFHMALSDAINFMPGSGRLLSENTSLILLIVLGKSKCCMSKGQNQLT